MGVVLDAAQRANMRLNSPVGITFFLTVTAAISVAIQPQNCSMHVMFDEGGNMRNKVRFALFGLLIGAGFALAPAAFARGHVSLGIGIGLPGLSLGYSDCRPCYGGYYGGGYSATYYGPAPVYYAPAPAYYGPAYYGAVYNNYPARGYYRSGRAEGRGYNGRDNGRRASYYDRGGYRH